MKDNLLKINMTYQELLQIRIVVQSTMKEKYENRDCNIAITIQSTSLSVEGDPFPSFSFIIIGASSLDATDFLLFFLSKKSSTSTIRITAMTMTMITTTTATNKTS